MMIISLFSSVQKKKGTYGLSMPVYLCGLWISDHRLQIVIKDHIFKVSFLIGSFKFLLGSLGPQGGLSGIALGSCQELALTLVALALELECQILELHLYLLVLLADALLLLL
jgi:hypothetical protein